MAHQARHGRAVLARERSEACVCHVVSSPSTPDRTGDHQSRPRVTIQQHPFRTAVVGLSVEPTTPRTVPVRPVQDLLETAQRPPWRPQAAVRRCLRIRKPWSAQPSCAPGRGACAVGCARHNGCAPDRGCCAIGPCATAAHRIDQGCALSCADTQVAVRRRCRRQGAGTSAQRCAKAKSRATRSAHPRRGPAGWCGPDEQPSARGGGVVGVLVGSTGTPTTRFVSSS